MYSYNVCIDFHPCGISGTDIMYMYYILCLDISAFYSNTCIRYKRTAHSSRFNAMHRFVFLGVLSSTVSSDNLLTLLRYI